MKHWCPKHREFYYYVDFYDDIITAMWVGSRIDKNRLKKHNVFRTRKDAKREFERQIAEKRLLELCDSSYILHWTIGYDDFESKFVAKSFDIVYSPYRFATSDSALEAIKTIGKDKLKLIFRID